MDKIAEALAQLDPKVDTDWTSDGAPRIDRVAALLGCKPSDLTRAQLTEAAPDLTRETHAAFVESLADGDAETEGAKAPPADEAALDASDEADVRAEYAARIAKGQEHLAKLEAERGELDQEIQRTKDRIDALINERDGVLPPVHPMDAVKAHLMRTHAARAARITGEHPASGLSPLERDLRTRKRQRPTGPVSFGGGISGAS